MALRSIDIRCDAELCGIQWNDLVEHDQRDSTFECPACLGPAHRTIAAPMVLRASYPDGYKRGEGYETVKQTARLRATAEQTASASDRTEMHKEIVERQIKAKGKQDKQVTDTVSRDGKGK